MAHIKYRAIPTLYMFMYSYYIYYRRDKVLASYNNTTHTTRTMPSDTGPACIILVQGGWGSKSQKGGPFGEVLRHDVSNNNKKHYEIAVFWKVVGR